MTALNGTPQRNRARDRKEAAKRLGFALQARYRALQEASGEDEIQTAAIALGGVFNDNIEFIFWVLKEYGGVEQMPYQPTRPALPKLSTELTGQDN